MKLDVQVVCAWKASPSEMQFQNKMEQQRSIWMHVIELLWNINWRIESQAERRKNADLVYFAPVARHFVHIVCHWDECATGTGMLRDKGKYRKCVASRYWFESRCYCENWTLHFRLPLFFFNRLFQFSTLRCEMIHALAHFSDAFCFTRSISIYCLSFSLALLFLFVNCYFSIVSFFKLFLKQSR